MGRLVDVQEEPVMPRSRRPDLLGGTLTNRELQILAYQKTCLSGSDISRVLNGKGGKFGLFWFYFSTSIPRTLHAKCNNLLQSPGNIR